MVVSIVSISNSGFQHRLDACNHSLCLPSRFAVCKSCGCIGKLERALGAANTPLLQPGVARPPRPNSGCRAPSGGRPNSAGRASNPNPPSALAAVGRVSPLGKAPTPLKPSLSSKHVAMATDPSQPSTPAADSPSQQQRVTQAQTPTENQGLGDAEDAGMPSEPTAVDASEQPVAETMAAVEADAAVGPVLGPSHSWKRPVKLQSIVNQTMGLAQGGEGLATPRYHVGQGFAKWISKAVGITALKEKTEIQDLPAYRLRVSSCCPTHL